MTKRPPVHSVVRVEAAHIEIVVEVLREGSRMHVVRTVRGQVQHKFLSAEIHDDAAVLAHAELTYLRGEVARGRLLAVA